MRRLFWAILITLAGILSGTLSAAMSTASSIPVRLPSLYDSRPQARIGYDALYVLDFDYDSTSTASTAERQRGTVGAGADRADLAGFEAAKSAGQLGREGEALASQITGAAKNTESWVVNGRVRIHDQVLAQDILTRNPTHIVEVKNVQYQALTQQLRDYSKLVGPGGRVDVALPPGARVSGPWLDAFNNPLNPLNRIDLVPPLP